MKKLLILAAAALLAGCLKLPEVPTLGVVEMPVAAEAEEEIVWSSTDYEGKPVLIMFMGSWCPYCKMSMPALNEVAKKYDGKAEVVGAFMDNDKATVLAVAKEHGLTTKILYDAGPASQVMEVTGLPHAVLFDKKHRAVKVWEGFSPTLQEEFTEQLDRLTD